MGKHTKLNILTAAAGVIRIFWGQSLNHPGIVGPANILLDESLPGQAGENESYYAMYYACRALLETRGLRPRTHPAAASLLFHHFVQTGLLPAAQHQNFVHARDMRRRVDYQHHVPTRDEAERLLNRAQQFVARADTLI